MKTSQTPIIDFHAHAAGIGAGDSGCHVSPGLMKNWRYKIYLKAFGVQAGELEKHGDKLLFKRLSKKIDSSQMVSGAVVLALDGIMDDQGKLDLSRTEIYIPNEFVHQETNRYPNLLYGASVNPYRHDAIERLTQAAKDGATLIKWLPSIQNIDPADPKIISFYKAIKNLGLPLLTHTGAEKSFTNACNALTDPQRLHLPLKQGVTVIAAHAASTGRNEGEDNMNRLFRMFDEYPNLYTDISSLTQLNKLGYLKRLLKKRQYYDRLIYGTDFPLINTALVSPWYFPISLSWQQIRKINKYRNPWDRDVALKSALGVPSEVFTRGTELFASD